MTLTKDHFDADDLVQETMIKALASEAQYTEKGCLRSWLATILRNKFIDHVRRNNARNLTEIKDFDDSFSVPPDAPSKLACDDVRRALGKLSGATAEVMLLRAEGYKFNEIAKKLGLSLSNAKIKAHFAYKKLGWLRK